MQTAPVVETLVIGSGGSIDESEFTRVARSEDIATAGPKGSAEDALQVAARLKLLRGSGGFLTVAGLDARDCGPQLAVKLAMSTAFIGHTPVLLIEGNTASPRLPERFGVASEPGLLDVLGGSSDLTAAVHQVEARNLCVMPYGSASSTLSALLASPQGVKGLAAIRERFSYVFADVGAVLSDPESLLLASASDGIVVALAQGTRRRHEVVHFRDELRRFNLRLLGVVLTSGTSKKR